MKNIFKKFNIYCFLLVISNCKLHATPSESWYQDIWCAGMGGIIEEKVAGGRRIDCLTATHAIEMDFAWKWHEALGQSLEYSFLSKKKAGIVLILVKENDIIYWERLNKIVDTFDLPITLWKLGP